MSDLYLQPIAHARWAISRVIFGKRIYLIQNTAVDDEAMISPVLQAVGIDPTAKHIDLYFPERPGRGRCPTLELLELFSEIDRVKRKNSPEVGV